jgi:hypothetical protein
VVADPDARFANIDAVERAMDEAAEQEARIKAREPEKEAKRTADEFAEAKMQDFMFEWRAYLFWLHHRLAARLCSRDGDRRLQEGKMLNNEVQRVLGASTE